MATTEDTGLSVSDWVGIGGALLTLVAIPLGLIGAHFHSAVRNDDARAKLIERLTTTGARDAYHERLGGLLTWFDERIGPPPFARHNPHGRRIVGVASLGACVTLSLAYSVGSWLAGWVFGAPGGLGQVILIETGNAPDLMLHWAPTWLSRIPVALLFIVGGLFLWWSAPHVEAWADQAAAHLSQLGRRLLGLPGAMLLHWVGFFGSYFGALAGAGTAALAVASAGGEGTFAAVVIVAGVLVLLRARALVVVGALAAVLGGEAGLITLLFWLALPWLNGFLDWISLSVSRWFGRAIVAERDSPTSLLWTLGLALADLLAAVAFAFMVAWLLAFGVEASALGFDISLELESYVEEAAASPWTTGFWATFMVLSTLVPTAIHFVLAGGAVAMAWSGNPLRAWAARKLARENEVDWLGPQLYLTFGWLVPTLLVPAALLWLIAALVSLIEPLPDALCDTALHGIATAQAWLR